MDTPRALAHPLRRVIVIAFGPALLLNIIEAAVVGSGLPLIGVLAHLASTIICIAYLRLGKRGGEQEGAIRLGPSPDKPGMFFRRSWFLFALDAILAAIFFPILVLRWVWVPRYAGQAVLATYAEIPLLLALACHAYLCLLTLQDLLGLRHFAQLFTHKPCPCCQNSQRPIPSTMGSGFNSQHQDFGSQAPGIGADPRVAIYRDSAENETGESADREIYATDNRSSHNPKYDKEVGLGIA
ncbi:unnamed protein product [Clonostachys rhizophaga]|uniref:Uncharacterized protein n=1 Tax=Clonostachys rhizophaga TaxID=160324 RepID=A0A9N9YRK1_9HYPO|nr:unnamed protein product [Clonostachys rhizophaga]